MTTALEEGKGSASRPGHSLPPKNTRHPLHRMPGGPQGRSRQARKISPPPGFDPRTAQPVASRHTDYATWPTAALSASSRFSNSVLRKVAVHFGHQATNINETYSAGYVRQQGPLPLQMLGLLHSISLSMHWPSVILLLDTA
jgi:hypothetical protein